MPKIGQTISIKSGPFAGQSGVIEQIEGTSVTARIELFGREMSIVLQPGEFAGGEPLAERWQRTIEGRRQRIQSIIEARWWHADAPDAPEVADAAFRAMQVALVPRLADASAAAFAQMEANPDSDLMGVIEAHLPALYWTPGHAAAVAEGRVTSSGAPKLTDAEHTEVVEFQRIAFERAQAARRAAAAARVPEVPGADQRRRAARVRVEAGKARWQARVRDCIGLTLPDHVFDFYAFWLSLTPDELSMFDGLVGVRPGMLFDWCVDVLPTPIDDRDVRLHGRFTGTPPEMLHALWGNIDGLHWGLWYDADDAQPRIASFYGRDGGGISLGPSTLLGVVLEQLDGAWDTTNEASPSPETDDELVRLERLETAAREFMRSEGHGEFSTGRIPTCDGIGVPFDVLDAPPSRPSVDTIYEAIRADDPVVETWVHAARTALADGVPQLALAIGRDLHWIWHSERPHHQRWAADLMSRAHAALGHPALAAIARAHANAERFHRGIGVYLS